jgi:Tfp pilus assembly PilM family ATPase
MRLSTNSLQNQTGYGLALDEEEDLKRLSSESSVENAMTLAAGTLIDQIAQAVEADAGSVATRYVALCGGGAQLRGFKERLQRRLGVDVRLGQPWAHLARTRSNLDYFHNGREDPRLMLSLTTATGLALWRDIP